MNEPAQAEPLRWGAGPKQSTVPFGGGRFPVLPRVGRASAFGAAMAARPLRVAIGLLVLSWLVTWLFGLRYAGSDAVRGTDYAAYYEPVARRIVNGDGLVLSDGTSATRYPPGYALIVAAILAGSAHLGVPESVAFAFVAILCASVTSLILYSLARTVWTPAAAVVASLLWITYPFALWLTVLRGTEIPFTLAFCGSFASFWSAWWGQRNRWPYAVVAGLLAGAAMLIRPIGMGIPFILAGLLAITRRDKPARQRWGLAAMLLLATLVAVLPWEAWVYSRTGRVVPLSTGGSASARDGLTFAVNLKGFRRGVSVPIDVALVMQEAHSRYETLDSGSAVASLILEQLRERPVAVAKLFLIKAARSWYGSDSNRQEQRLLLVQAVYLLMIAWGTWAAWRAGSAARHLAVSVWLLAIYFWGMTTLVLSIARYMVPVMGLLFLLVPAGIHRLLTDSQRSTRPA